MLRFLVAGPAMQRSLVLTDTCIPGRPPGYGTTVT